MTIAASLNIEEVIKRIEKIVEANGNVSQKTKDELQWTAIMAILEAVKPLPDISKRVESLESKNIIMQAEKHPKVALAVLAGFVLFIVWAVANPVLQQALADTLHRGLP